MLIVCPACVSTYRIDPAVLGEACSTVRCAHCRRTWQIGGQGLAETSPGPTEIIVAPVAVPSAAVPEGHHPAAAGGLVSPRRSAKPPLVPSALQKGERSAVRTVLLTVLGIGLGMACVAGRDRVAAAIPATAHLFQLLGLPTGNGGLDLVDVRSDVSGDGLGKALTVVGEIKNTRAISVLVPELRLVVRDQAAQKLYSWTAAPPKRALGPGESVNFESRMADPPDAGRDLLVTFAEAEGSGQTVRVKEER